MPVLGWQRHLSTWCTRHLARRRSRTPCGSGAPILASHRCVPKLSPKDAGRALNRTVDDLSYLCLVRPQTDVADVTVAGVSCKDSLVWHGRTELSCVVTPPFASLVLGEPFVGNVTVITYSGAPRAVPPPPTNYIVQPCMFWRPKGCSRAPWPEPDTLLPPPPCYIVI